MLPFANVWLVEAQFAAVPGERPVPLAIAAVEVRTGQAIGLAGHALRLADMPVALSGHDVLVVARDAHEVIACFLSLGWRVPLNVLDVAVEARVCGLSRLPGQHSTFASTIGRTLPCTETDALLYCRARLTEVAGQFSVYEQSQPQVPLAIPHALLRGRYSAAVARMEALGVPVDVRGIAALRGDWRRTRRRLLARIDPGHRFFVAGRLREDRWVEWVESAGIRWPRLPSGRLDLDDDAWRSMTRAHPLVAATRALRNAIRRDDIVGLTIGRDGRNRSPLMPFGTVTGRNTPSSVSAVFHAPGWQRFFVVPEPGWGLAVLDYVGAEVGIAAGLSADVAMQAAYERDLYVELARRAALIPAGATKESHPFERGVAKDCALGVIYGIVAMTLSMRTGIPLVHAEHILATHHREFATFWAWLERAANRAVLLGQIHAPHGWRMAISRQTNPLTIRNFVPQATCAEIMRLACILAIEAGIHVHAPVHDAMVIGAPIHELSAAIRSAREFMIEASRLCLGGFALQVEVRSVRHPRRLGDERYAPFWEHLAAEVRELAAPLTDEVGQQEATRAA